MKEDIILFPNDTGFLKGAKAAVVFKSSKDMFSKPEAEPIDISWTKKKKYGKVVPWGADNDLPQQIISKVEKSPDLSTGLLFNIQVGYGDGVIACRFDIDKKGKKIVVPVYDNTEINEFFEYNDINGYLLEQLIDINYFYNAFPEIILDRQSSNKRKIVELTSKEATFSRWEEMNKRTAKIEHHFYSAKWNEGNAPEEKDIEVTPALDFKRSIPDILGRIGRNKRKDGKLKDDKEYRYIVPVNFPTPGRSYNQKPHWFSIIESGWIGFATSIPEFKEYLIKNGMTIRYIIYLSDDYFPDIFAREGIKEKDKMKARITKEYTDLNKYLTGLKNTGKSMISFYKASPDGTKQYRIEIQVIENNFKGGEYLEDSGEVSNMIAYTLGVHPSLIGATPGKNSGSFSGTDKRELFIIKQALLKPIRDRLLRPLYLVKAVNKWPADIHFAIPNIELTTLDKNKTGVETKVT
jgi:hypothetical protein